MRERTVMQDKELKNPPWLRRTKFLFDIYNWSHDLFNKSEEERDLTLWRLLYPPCWEIMLNYMYDGLFIAGLWWWWGGRWSQVTLGKVANSSQSWHVEKLTLECLTGALQSPLKFRYKPEHLSCCLKGLISRLGGGGVNEWMSGM